ncbi:hypothetical protein F0562_011136 [Nyssa sinensis]|uniref:Pre-rRNA-processing protein TSR2 homolog n=1 Tax=Nyssa sinensis TaxID=561372 RepID=A0A5J5A100_9ASTE|nr:hypothetical protein F0562_011136 [Nyssa sinensis]
MESINRNGVVTPSRCLKPEIVSRLQEGISVLLSRWTGLQMAVKYEWGGRDSLKKFEQLAADILSWFSQSKAPHCVEDLRICCMRAYYLLSTQRLRMEALRKLQSS